MSSSKAYRKKGTGVPANEVEAVIVDGALTDIVVRRNGRALALLGPAGKERELGILAGEKSFLELVSGGGEQEDVVPDRAGPKQKAVPVLIGSGIGAALAEICKRLEAEFGPAFILVVVDKEDDILAVSELKKQYAAYPGVTFVSQPSVEGTLAFLTELQTHNGGIKFFPILNPFYLRLDRDYYSKINEACAASCKAGFWEKAVYPKFKGEQPRILLLTSKYFLMGEIISACERLGVPNLLLTLPDGEFGKSEFVESLLEAVLEFKPDFVFTINHLGVDREGILSNLLGRLRLPLASWFVDNPHLVLYLYDQLVSPWTSIFTWDADNILSLRQMGFEHVNYLSLGVDATRFKSATGAIKLKRRFPRLPAAFDGRVSFVGNSMVHKVTQRMERLDLPDELLADYTGIAADFGKTEFRSVRLFLESHRPDLISSFNQLPTPEMQLGYETMLTWEATRQYRLSCVSSMLPFNPLIVGDDGWKGILPSNSWHYHPEMNYYSDLPDFYPCSQINFNCTSKQMKGAVNQRVFDVPATGAFLLTDYREQVENLFEPGKEIVCYHSPEEAEDLAAYFLKHPAERTKISTAARSRILKEHTYEHRLTELIDKMRSLYQ